MRYIGQRVRRVEDPGLLTGVAEFTGGIGADAFEICFVRSLHAHARIMRIDLDAARLATGVVGVFSARDFDSVVGHSAVPVPPELLRPHLATDRVRFVGEIVAVVVARSWAEAQDAAELVAVEYEPLPHAVDVAAAMAEDAPLLFEGLGTNRVMRIEGAPSAGFADDADVIVEIQMCNQRVGAVPLETNAVLAIPDGDGLLVHASTQAPHNLRDAIAQFCALEPGRVRVIAPSVGGAFGAKSTADPELALTCLVARRLREAVRWRQTRTENLTTMHGRAQHQHVWVAARADGTLLRLHADLVSDGGGYPGINHFLSTLTAQMLAGIYRFDAVTSSLTAVATNTVPPFGYRGAGRPEAASLVERVVDIVAAELGIDPVELRRRNLIPASAFPYTSPTGAVYDSGDYAAALDRALELAHYDERRAEQSARRAAGSQLLLGIGVCSYVEVTAGARPVEFADVEIRRDGTAVVRVGTFGHGQGHHTSFAQIAAETLGVPFERVSVIDGDTGRVERGAGTYGSRSMQVGGSAVRQACVDVVDRARALAADRFEAALEDIAHGDDGFAVAGVPAQTVSWSSLADVASHAARDGGSRVGLHATVDWERPAATFPFGTHVAIVEVDRETGVVRLVEHVAVDDCGTIINPMLAEGQVHGGVAQGAAQALFEEIVIDEAGNVLTSNLADYCCVGATELPTFTLGHTVTPTPVNPMGVKGIGESGTIGATPAVQNAVVDALAHLGVRHLEMPCTPERVWRALEGERYSGLRVDRRTLSPATPEEDT